MSQTKCVTLPNETVFVLVDSELRQGRDVILRVKGSSMLPTLREDRDSVRLQRRDVYRVGDVVLAQIASDWHVLHRIVALEGNRVTLHGDGILRGDEHCLLTDIKGLAIGRIDVATNRERPLRKARVWRHLPRLLRRVLLRFFVV
mgnify:CR=1 FL=1